MSPKSPAVDLERRLAAVDALLDIDPESALEEACLSARWILEDLHRRHFDEPPGNRRFLELLERLGNALPRRIRIQLQAIAGYREALGDEAPEESLTSDDVRPCLQALQLVGRWYLDSLREASPAEPPSSPVTERSDPSQASLSTASSLAFEPAPPRRARKSYPVRWAGLVALGVGVVGLFLLQLLQVQQFAERRLGVVLGIQAEGGLEISGLTPNGPAERAGIQVGDRVTAFDGTPTRSIDDVFVTQDHVDRGTPIPVEILREAERLQVEIKPGIAVEWTVPVVNGLAMAACAFLAILVLNRRRIDLRSRLLGTMLWLQAFELALPRMAIDLRLEAALWIVILSLSGAQMGVDLHLASMIPERQRWLLRWPWVVYGYYILSGGLWLGAALTFALEAGAESPLPWTFESYNVALLNAWVLPLWPLSVLVLLGYPALRHPTADGRQQARIVWLAFLPWFIFVVGTTLADWWELDVSAWSAPLFPLLMLCFPGAVWAVMEHEAKKKRRILLNLVREIRRSTSVPELSESLARDLDAAFHPKELRIFFQDPQTEGLTLSHSTAASQADAVVQTEEIPPHFSLLRNLEVEGGNLLVPDDLDSSCPTEELVWLDERGVRVLVAMRDAESHLVGVLTLGDKRSEEIYTGQDLKLLMSLAGQISLAFQNLGLQSRLDQKIRIQREVLDRFRDQELDLVQECPKCGRCFDQQETHCPDDGHELSLTVPVERTIRGRYRLDRTLGKGGIGSVYAATDLRLDRRVAVKVLLGSALDDPVVRRRFEREARIVAQLTHPNIVTLYDCGTTSVGNAFIVLELLEGHTLRRALRQQPRLDPKELARIIDQVLYALMAAHSEDIVHRDLKPGNVFLATNRGNRVAKLLDFGIAKIKSVPLQGELTSPGAVLGTHGYMAPEQLLGNDLDERADLYSVGVMVVEGLTGQRPRRGSHPLAASEALAKVPLEIEGIPETRPLAEVMRRCLATRPEARPASAAALRQELIPALEAYPTAEEIEQRLTPQESEATEKIELTGHLGDSIDELRRQLRRRRRRDPAAGG